MSQLENSAGGWPGPVAVRNYTNYRGCQSGGGLGWAGLGWAGLAGLGGPGPGLDTANI